MAIESLLSAVQLRAGPGCTITRDATPDWAARIAQGRPAALLPELMAGSHALCAHGHRLAAQLAVQAALGRAAAPDGAARQALQRAVLREQLLRIAHDWPRLLGERAANGLPLDGAPLWLQGLEPEVQLAQLPGWLEQRWLGRTLAQLLHALTGDDGSAALRWARSTGSALAHLLAEHLPPALALHTPQRPLREPATVSIPERKVPDTGPWCRHHDPRPAPAHNAGMRLIARLVDVLRLAAPAGADWLHLQAGTVAPGVGRSSVELGRGQLAYEVELADAPGGPVVRALRIASPTDWNFHPAGVLAEALVDAETAADVRRLAVAFDPCVPFHVEQPEPAHA